MDEQKNGGEMAKCKGMCGGGSCGCGCGCGGGCGHGHRLIRWVIIVVILVFVFALGVKVGEFRDELHSMYGGYNYNYPMMQGRVYNDGVVPVGAQGNVTGTTSNAPMIPAGR